MSASQAWSAGKHAGAPGLRRPISWCLLPVLAGLLLSLACARGPRPSEEPSAPVTPSAPAEPDSRDDRPPSTPGASSAPPVLTIWGPDAMAPFDDTPGGAVLAAQIRAFSEAHPGWQVRYVRKKPHGQGGLVHFLLSTQAAAPEELPDLVLLDMSEVGLVGAGSLLQPLEGLLGEDTVADLAPFAREAGQVNDHLVAVQYEADLELLAYNPDVIATPPSTWSELLAAQATYLLPIGATEGAVRDSFLPQYLALGGKLVDRDGLPSLDQTLVAAILDVYQAACDARLLPAAGFDLKDASECWPIFLTSRAALTNVSTWDYGRELANHATSSRVAPLPTLSGTLFSMSSGWGWGLVTKDPARQALAMELLRSFMAPEAMSAWSRATYHLPSRRSALSLAVSDADYRRLVQRLMEVAVPQPREPFYSLATEALSEAIENVARGKQTPTTAATEAATKVRNAREELASGSQY